MTCNIAQALVEMAGQRPYKQAVIFPHGRSPDGKVSYTHYTYRQLNQSSDRIAGGLRAIGIGPGVRTALMVTPSLEFFALTFGIFKAGAVPVLIDPGIGLANMKSCLNEARPTGFIGVPKAHLARALFGWGRKSITKLVTVGGRRWFWGGHNLQDLMALDDGAGMSATQAEDKAAIIFTSGSTGAPKGVVYQHQYFVNQVNMLRDVMGFAPGEIDLPTFPLFALFDPALGMTTIVPDMDPTRPAQVDPRKLIEAIEDYGVTNMFGSPALLNTLTRYGLAHDVKLPSLRRLISNGAPVPAALQRDCLSMLGEGVQVFSPYGATEALPVCNIGSDEVLAETAAKTDQGAGVCVGRPVPPNRLEIIGIDDEAISTWSEDLIVADGTIGEITVKGPTVTAEYLHRPEATAQAKIADPDGGHWHRMGDLGWRDEQGRIWFCGRKVQRVQANGKTYFTVPCEAVFNTHPSVYRSALVAGAKGPVLCVELQPEAQKKSGADMANLKKELRELALKHEQTIDINEFLIHPGFPVDIRHNAKIRRGDLAQWVAREQA